MAGLGANALYHFTSFDGLKGILSTGGFWPRLVPERMPVLVPNILIAIPMVSFCDIRLTQVEAHANDYGKYAIGLTKQWGRKAGINPVLYLDEGSGLANSITTSIGVHFKRFDMEKKALSMDSIQQVVFQQLMRILSFCKVSEGVKWDPATESFADGPTVRFYDEREWRYVSLNDHPITSNMIPLDFHPLWQGEKYSESGSIAKRNSTLRTAPLNFVGSDIRHILVKEEADIEPLLSDVRWGHLFQTREQLMARVRVYDDVLNDY